MTIAPTRTNAARKQTVYGFKIEADAIEAPGRQSRMHPQSAAPSLDMVTAASIGELFVAPACKAMTALI